MLYEKIIPADGYSFSKRNFIFKHFPSDWHYHPESELILITGGFGKRFVGNGVSEFREGDVALIGANIPHFHMSDKCYYENNDLCCSSEVIQFTQDIFPSGFDSMREFKQIYKLLKNSERGIVFDDEEVVKEVREMFPVFESLKGINILTELYRILDLLGKVKNYRYLSTLDYEREYIGYEHNTPVARTYQYLMNNFKNSIKLKDIAEYAGQNHTALCRNFKQSTGKNIFVCLLEIRIEFAYKLLTNSDFSIIQVAYEAGFSNISHFNHKFKQLSGISPTEYRKIHRR